VLNLIWDMEVRGGGAALATAGGVPRHRARPATGSVEGMGTPDRGAAPIQRSPAVAHPRGTSRRPTWR
jgi:hypothetical protein